MYVVMNVCWSFLSQLLTWLPCTGGCIACVVGAHWWRESQWCLGLYGMLGGWRDSEGSKIVAVCVWESVCVEVHVCVRSHVCVCVQDVCVYAFMYACTLFVCCYLRDYNIPIYHSTIAVKCCRMLVCQLHSMQHCCLQCVCTSPLPPRTHCSTRPLLWQSW